MRALLIAIFLFVCSSNGHAERQRFVVFEFDGDAPREVRSEVIRILKEDFMVLSLKTWKKTATRLSASKATPANVRRVAKELRVRAVIQGASVSRRNGYELSLDVRSGKSGRSMAKPTLTTTKSKLDKASKRALAKVVDQIESM